MGTLVPRLIQVTRAIAGLSFFALLLCVFAGVMSRYAFNAPLTFTDEIAGYLFAASVLLGMAVTAFHGGHIRVDLLSRRLSPEGQRRIEAGHWVLSVVFAIVLLAAGVNFFLNALSKGLRAPTVLQTPIALVGIMLPISMVLFLIERIDAARNRLGDAPSEPDRGQVV